jgi:hypothetical protein
LDADTNQAYLSPPSAQDDSIASNGENLQYPQFKASTFTMATLCRSINCDLSFNDEQKSYFFNCPQGFSSNATTSWFEAGPWIQPPNDDHVYGGYTGLSEKHNRYVGLEWGIFVHLDDFRFRQRHPSKLHVERVNDPVSKKPSSTFVLQCNSSLSMSTYSWENNSLVAPLAPSIANQTPFGVELGAFLSQGSNLY